MSTHSWCPIPNNNNQYGVGEAALSLNNRTVFVLIQEIQLSLFLIYFWFIFKTNIKGSTLKVWTFLYIAVKLCSAEHWSRNILEERRLGRRPWTTANLPEYTFQMNRKQVPEICLKINKHDLDLLLNLQSRNGCTILPYRPENRMTRSLVFTLYIAGSSKPVF